MPRLQPTRISLALAAAFSASFALADSDPAPIALPVPPQSQGQTYVTADHMDGQMQDNLKARGNVVVTRDNQKLESDWLDYYQQQNRVKAGDKFRLTRDRDVVTGTTLDYLLDSHTGNAQQPVFVMGTPEQQNTAKSKNRSLSKSGVAFRGDGREVEFTGPDQYRLKDSRVNACVVGDDSWYLKSGTLDLNYATNIGVARNAHLEFQGVPILYTPWIDFPLDGGRKSGFLSPTFKSGSSGTEFAIPYYWNIAPNYDATITPHFNTKHGTMLGAEFRYLQPDYYGTIYTEQLPNDPTTGGSRFAWNAMHRQTLAPGLTFGYDYNYVSDVNYFKDFGDRYTIATNTNLLRQAWFNYGMSWEGGNANTLLRMQRYQTLEDPIIPADQPYARVPQIAFTANQKLPEGFSANLQSELTRFSHPTLQSGDRFVAYPSVSWNFDRSWGFLKPKIGVHYTTYSLDDMGSTGTQGKHITRTLPIFSTDSGLYFERDAQLFGEEHVQTLEPRLYYVYIPARDQSAIPNFDTSENDFNFSQMFSENRFSGSDRINPANQVTAAVTTRFINSENGLERLRLMVGQRYYLNQTNINLAGQLTDNKDTGSDLLMSLGGDLTRDWRLDSSYEYNQELSKTERYNAQVRYNPEPGKSVSLRYRYGRYEQVGDTTQYGPLRQVDLAVQWPIARQWYGLARENYSLIDRKSLEQLVGLEYNDGCWSLRFVGQRYVTDQTNTKTGIFVQLELRGLGGLGSNPSSELKLAIPGYTPINDIQQH